MKELSGQARTAISAPPAECIALLAAVDRYPTWYPDVIRKVEVIERDGSGVVRRARVTVHLSVGPLANDYTFEINVEVAPAAVILSRVPHKASDPDQLEVHWRVKPGELRVDVSAVLEVPRFLPVGGAGEAVAQGFVKAARRVLDDLSVKASASSS
jgi:ribosome-associated toxin RatA of RatAB toxin-antitoxin module